MAFRQRREKLRAILSGARCIRPGSVYDATSIRIADDLDIVPDGRIFFSEATVRYETHDWPVDALESRGNGRLICFDPRDRTTRTVIRNLVFPNGVVTAHDGQSILIASTTMFRVDRLWISGPKQGQFEPVLENLPGAPDNINRASDGNYWLSFVGMRTPFSDLVLRHPQFRLRMTKQLPMDAAGALSPAPAPSSTTCSWTRARCAIWPTGPSSPTFAANSNAGCTSG